MTTPQRKTTTMTTTFVRSLWLAGALLLSLITGIGGGVLDWLGGDHPAKAIIAGAAAFAATMALAILILTFVDPGGTARSDRR
jgi:hypothetical protein